MTNADTLAEQLARLPQYQCHKVVRAARILAIGPNPRAAGFVVRLEMGDPPEGLELDVSLRWRAKHDVHVGGYFVVYDDGYLSYSPAAAFESGYTKIDWTGLDL
jgi:hypothetical protein